MTGRGGEIHMLGWLLRRHCKKIQLLLPWYANGTLSGEEWAQVEAHLARCRRCRRELEGFQRLQARVQSALEGPHLEPSEDLISHTLEQVLLEEEAEKLKRRLEEELLKLLQMSAREAEGPEGPKRQRLGELHINFFLLGFSLGVAYERGRLPFEAELTTLGLPLSKIKGKI